MNRLQTIQECLDENVFSSPLRAQGGLHAAMLTVPGWLNRQGRAWHSTPRDRTTNRWRYGSYRPAYIWDDDNADDPALAA